MALGAFLLVFLQLTAASMDATTADKGVQPTTCNRTCGEVEIPYPFGVGDGCYADEYRNSYFNVSCNYSANPPRPFIHTDHTNLNILDISLGGQCRIGGRVAFDCYDREGNIERGRKILVSLGRNFRFSHTQNKFVVLGCDSIGLINGTKGVRYVNGCFSTCLSKESVGEMGGNCWAGVGCCETTIPRGLFIFDARINSFSGHRSCWEFNPCGYAFLVDKSSFTFNASDIGRAGDYRDPAPPVVVDWSIGNQMCREVQESPDLPYACRSDHSVCFDSNSGVGYNCKCEDGFEGNPYLRELGGCRDIDECRLNSTICPSGNCTNTAGSYNCTCPPGTFSEDPKKEPCLPPVPHTDTDTLPFPLKMALGLGLGIFLLMAVAICLCWGYHRRKLVEQTRKVKELKQKLFEQNGGPFLQELLLITSSSSSQAPAANTFRIFTEEELAAATNGFDDGQIVGRGGHGIVYRGRLQDDTEVAIKKSRMVDERQSKEFAREIGILSQINHVNVVKLLGCCLEVEIPMLVYEFVPCGTLYDFIHHAGGGDDGASRCRRPAVISLDMRMRIATEAAEALAYLHSYASRPILHGDVKTSNILLDENYMAKVSDFGASTTLAPADEVQLATVVQGTCGYLDPEYLQTYRLTTKSDVYSFGVVLAELLTGKKPLQLQIREEASSEDERGLAVSFVSSLRSEKKLMQILDAHVVEEGEPEMLWEIAVLACRCLSMTGDDRPTMKEVVTALHVLRRPPERPWSSSGSTTREHAPEESESLLAGAGSSPSDITRSTSGGATTTCYLSMQNDVTIFDVDI